MKKNILIVGNWKMNKDIESAEQTIQTLKNNIGNINSNINIVICPSFTALYTVNNILKGSKIKLGAQNVFWANDGAFTGEISTSMLKNVGCSYVILGHSERREYLHETYQDINKKVIASLNASIIPIVCIGESLKEREEDLTFSIIKQQIETALENTQQLPRISSLVLAYEPLWAIGTGKTATPYQAQQVHAFIRELCEEKYGLNIASQIQIIYGGSVKSDTITQLLKENDIDGGLIGGASLQVPSFLSLIKNALI
ncbi:MAG: triose-phosphate isomerase [Endomicrobium sp.]|jgi:triosephosphate isomerase|nr:triose-phosphate isomerase [Endomicrobium sp.]